jgi:hypothetical protein
VRRAVLLAILAACGDDDGVTGADADCIGRCDAALPLDAGADARPGAFDLQNGTWLIENVSNTPGTISHDGALAFTASGVAWVAFSEPLATSSSDQDVFVTSKPGGAWAAAAPLTNDTAVQNAFPSLVAVGETLHLCWNGYPEGANDIYYAVNEGGGFGARTNLTMAGETAPRDDFAPALAAGPGGALAVAYASHLDAGDTDAEIRVLRLAGGAASGAPVTAIPSPADGQSCGEPSMAFDAEGALHLIATCGPLFDGDIVYATDRGGTWTRMPLSSPGVDDFSADLVVDGGDVHVVWVAGDGDVRYTVSHGGAFAADISVTGSEVGRLPALAVDSGGRPLVMFQRANAEDEFDVFIAWLDGAAFAPARNVTEGTPTTTEWFPYALVLHPTTGLPHLTFVKLLPGTTPLDSEVMRAEFVPGT